MSSINAIGREQEEQNRRLNLLEAKINWFMVLMIATLAVGVMNLLIEVK